MNLRFVLAHTHAHDQRGHGQHAGRHHERGPEAENLGHDPAGQRPQGIADEDGGLHDAQREAKPLPGCLRGDQRLAGADGAGENALQKAEPNQLISVGGQPHQANQDRGAGGGPHNHHFAAIAIGQHAPNRRGNGHTDGDASRHHGHPERDAGGPVNAQLLDV